MKKYKFSSILGWSSSRYKKFNICQRQYFYHYYGKHDSDHDPDKISFLKGLSGYPLYKGKLIHEIMETLLVRLQKSPIPISQKQFWSYVEMLAKKRIEDEWFREDYVLGKKTDKGRAVKAVVADCKVALSSFFESKFYKYLLQTAKKDSLSWLVEPGDYGETRIAGMKAYCKVDFLDATRQDKKYIWDWKTGKQRKDDIKQVSVYGQWAMSEGIVKNAEDLIIGLVYLGADFDIVMKKLTQEEFDATVPRVQGETKEMYSMCRNIDQNIPKDKRFFVAKNNGLQKFPCAWCNFSTLCQEEGLI